MARPTPPVLLGIVIVVATLGAIPVPALQTGQTGGAETAAVLPVDGAERSGYANQSVDVSTAVATGHETAVAKLRGFALEAAFEDIESTATRRQLLLSATARLENRTTALRLRARTLRAAYIDRDIGTGAYLDGLSRIDARARALQRRAERISRLAEDVPGTSIAPRLGLIHAALQGYTGPVRQRVTAANAGTDTPVRVYAIVAPNGTAISMIDGDRYVREAHLPARFSGETDPDVGVDDVFGQLPTLYPTYGRGGVGIFGLPRFDQGVYFRIDLRFSDETVSGYFDSGARTIYHEVRVRDLGVPSSNRSATATANGTRLVVNRTYPGGPLRIATYDGTSGQPVSARIEVAGREVRTGDDGVVWVIGPRLATRVTATRADGTVSVLVNPVDPTPVNGTATGA